MSRRFWVAMLALLVAFTLTGPAFDGPAQAEVIRLKNGRMLQGEIDSARTTDDAITISLYRDGAVLRVLWTHVLGRDARRLREALGLDVLEGETLLIPGHELILTTGETMRGLLIDAPEGGDGTGNWYLKTADGGRVAQAVPRRLVQGVNEIEIAVLEVFSLEEAVERKIAEIVGERIEDDLSWQDHLAIADFAFKLGAYAQAKAWYEKALEDEDCPGETAIRNKLKNLGILVQAAEAGDLFGQIKRFQFKEKYKDALDRVTEFREKYGALTQVIALYKLDQVEKRLRVSLKEQRIRNVSADWIRFMARLISSKVRDREVSWKDAMSYAQKDLTEDIVKELSAKMELKSEDVLELWKVRKMKARTASYGYGTFAAPEEASRAKSSGSGQQGMSREEIRRRLLEAARKRRSRGSSKEKPAKTAPDWWKGASSQARRSWISAFYVEHGNAQFEILRIYWDRCHSCTGNGYIVHNIAQSSDDSSGQEKVRCETCNGHGKIRMVRYK